MCKDIADCLSVESTCYNASITLQTFYNWLDAGARARESGDAHSIYLEFLESYEAAKVKLERLLLDKRMKATLDPEPIKKVKRKKKIMPIHHPDTGVIIGYELRVVEENEEIKTMPVRLRYIDRMLELKFPKSYGPRVLEADPIENNVGKAAFNPLGAAIDGGNDDIEEPDDSDDGASADAIASTKEGESDGI